MEVSDKCLAIVLERFCCVFSVGAGVVRVGNVGVCLSLKHTPEDPHRIHCHRSTTTC